METNMLTVTHPTDPIVNMGYVQSQFGRSARTIYLWVEQGILPPPLKINRYNGWKKSQIDAVVDKFSQAARGA